MELFTTTPASEMIPIMVIMITNSMRKMMSPRNTPIRLKITENMMMAGVLLLLNMLTMIMNTRKHAIISAVLRKAICFSCSFISPVNS